MKLSAGKRLKSLSMTTVRGKPLAVPDAGTPFTHLQFRRFTGCPICNTHVAAFRRRAEDIKAAGIHEVIFFHSEPDNIAKFQAQVPFDMVGDPQKKYYRQFGVESSLRGLFHPKVLWAALKGYLNLRVNYKMGGGISSLPADFLVAADGTIVAAKYGEHYYDQWDVDELIALTKS